MKPKSPLTEWREQYGLSVAELADLCNVTEAEIARVEAGEEGLIGDLQDCLTRRGENVTAPAACGLPFLPCSP
jgi:transcriptional regulator with XRE-family HTH domain